MGGLAMGSASCLTIAIRASGTRSLVKVQGRVAARTGPGGTAMGVVPGSIFASCLPQEQLFWLS